MYRTIHLKRTQGTVQAVGKTVLSRSDLASTVVKQVAMAWDSQKPEQRSRYRQDSGGPAGVEKRGMYRELYCELGRTLGFLLLGR